FVNREIPVITDEYADMEKGTGCVKITPAHDPNDFLVGQRHDLEQIVVMNDDATLNEITGKFNGMDRYEARKLIVKELEEMGILVKVEPTVHNVGVCYRCGTTVEPLISDQWFVKMEPLAKPAIEAVRNGTIKFIPDNQAKKYFNWMENIHDWCISRQLWWGHRIPAFYCDKCGKMIVSKEDEKICPDCGAQLRQEEDVLDTWFSSALWPFSTLGWPENTEDLKRYYPTSTLVTGYDIITFWVSRMIFSGLEHTGKAPFENVLIHGLVRDEQGRKMSKSLGNGIDPLEVIAQYGADALRFTLVTGNAPGNDMRFSGTKMDNSRNFANKMWNASRFVLLNLDEETKPVIPETLQIEDKWILTHLNNAVKEITANLDKFELGIAAAKLHEFIWDIFCDWYIEVVKPRLFDKGTEDNKNAQSVLLYVLTGILKLLHPFMPYITEEIWSNIKVSDKMLIVSDYPEYDKNLDFGDECRSMDRVIDAIRSVRNTRTGMNVPPSRKAKLYIVSDYADSFNEKTSKFFERLASASEVEVVSSYDAEGAVSIVSDGAKIFIPMAEMVDLEKERERLEKERQTALSEIERVDKKLSNASFVDKAPAAVVEAEKAKKEKYTEMLNNVEEMLKNLGK
ncbi:MAG: valine--tRNA ligase, partial [Clostridia bacterium]|nr:valine--tRNA ligase [Clostridia bacterium]